MEQQNNTGNTTALFNKFSIVFFSLILTSLGGALMFAYNLRATGKGKLGWPVVLISLLGTAVIRAVVKHFLPGSTYELFIPGLVWGLILAIPVWNKYLSDYPDYISKPPYEPALAAIVLYGAFFAFYTYSRR